MFKFSFVIPNYNRYDLCHQLMFDIYKTCSPVHEVIIVNDGCTQPESFSGLEWWQNTKMLPVHELRLDENVGFLKASNAGMKITTGDIVCLISNDVRVKGDIVQRVEHIVKDTPNVLIGGRMLSFNTGWNEFDGVIFPYIEGWLLIAHKNVWESVGYLDERFAPSDMEDIDISTTVMQKGGILVPLPDDMTFHMGAQSIGYTPEREEMTKRNKEKFRKKWIDKNE